MRLFKSLLCGISALVLATGAAFAGEDSTVHGSIDASPPELLSDEMNGSSMDRSELSLEESGVIYIYPMEITEYYLLIPGDSSETPG